MEPRPDLDTEVAHHLLGRQRAMDRAGGAVKGRQEAVAHGLHLAPVVTIQLTAHECVVALDHAAPAPVAQLGGALGRANDVREEHGG